MKNTTNQWLWSVPGEKRWYILSLTLVQSIHGGSGVVYALLLRSVVDAAVDRNKAEFWRFLLLTVALVAMQLALRAVIRWLTELSKSTLENRFKSRLLEALLSRDVLSVSAVHSGAWLNRLTNDTVVVAEGLVDILPGLAGMVVKLLSALAMIVALEPRFAAILIPGGAVLVVFTWLFRRMLKRLHKDVQKQDGKLRIFLQERMGSLLLLRSFAAEEQTKAAASEKMSAHQSARMRKNRFSNLCNIGFGSAMNGMYLLGVGWCGWGILTGRITFGTLTAITQLISQIQTPFANITGYLPRYYAVLASAERLMEAEQLPRDEQAPLSLPEVTKAYRTRLAAIGLREAAFAYYPPAESAERLTKEQMPQALTGLSFTIQKGEIVAFTGHSGCGKSTALKLLMCVYPLDSGERFSVDLDGTCWPLTATWRRLFAYVPQGNQLMSGTIREVVSFAEPDAAGDEIRLRQSLELACAWDFVLELEKGVDTLLGERGTGLSEGQMQRLAIARAVFSQRPILLLDESTSALDAQTERKLLENLRKKLTEQTVVIVTHRPTALSICDRVLVFTQEGVSEHDP